MHGASLEPSARERETGRQHAEQIGQGDAPPSLQSSCSGQSSHVTAPVPSSDKHSCRFFRRHPRTLALSRLVQHAVRAAPRPSNTGDCLSITARRSTGRRPSRAVDERMRACRQSPRLCRQSHFQQVCNCEVNLLLTGRRHFASPFTF
jgi:hypothetical protein